MGQDLQSAGGGHGTAAPVGGELHTLIAALASTDVRARAAARRALVGLGAPAREPLAAALRSPSYTVRWEAAKALSELADPASAPALVQALTDERFDVRWLAAVGLIALRQAGLVPLLEALEHASWDRVLLRDGARHILRAQLAGPHGSALAPVVAALEGAEPAVTVPLAAYRALGALRGESW
jgi:HEAT repeat protein